MNKIRIKILLMAAIFLMAANLSATKIKTAQAMGFGFYGGVIIAFIPPTVVCPPMTVVFDFASLKPISLYVSATSIIFPNFNLITTGVFVKGLDLPIPYPGCPAKPVQILMIGTS